MADKPHITPEDYVTRLVQVGVWATPENPIQYAFLTQHPAYLPNEPGWSVLSAAQRAAVQRAFAMISEVVNLTFVQVADNQQQPGPGNSRINFYANSFDLSFSGSMDPYQLSGSSAIYGADIRFNSARIAQRQSNEHFADFTSFVALHEVLHAVGLSHPGDYNGQGPTYANDAEFAEDTVQYSVMSYFAAAFTGADHFLGSVLYAGRTPLLYDILALQSLYAPNMTTRAGDTVYGFNSNTGADSPFNFAVTTGPVVAIWDGGGIDTIDLSGYSDASRINLNAGEFSDAGGLTKNIAIAFGVTIENAVGGAGADVIFGNAAANRLDGGTGNDTLRGGAGDDEYYLDQSGDVVEENAGEGIDTLYVPFAAFTLGDNLERLVLLAGALDGTGNSLANTLVGNGAANVLDGAAGEDIMRGGAGNDTYIVDNAGDQAVETLAADGSDTVQSSASFTLGAFVEKLILTGTAANATGNALANELTGNASANRLDGGLGADLLRGGAGNDVYVVDNEGDQAIETAIGDGVDGIESSVTFTAAANIENLLLTGAAAINGTGNALNNAITGNVAANTLDGRGGADVMKGGAGNDIYVVDSAADQAIELLAGDGHDSVYSSVTYTLAINLEHLGLTGAAAINGTGNVANNSLTGNAAANILDGRGGADVMKGGAGNDVYVVDNRADQTIELLAADGHDSVYSSVSYTLALNLEHLGLTGSGAINGTGNAAVNSLTGNSAANTLDGRAGADVMKGGAGNDIYVVDNVADQAIELNAADGHDSVYSSVSYSLGGNIEHLGLTGTSAINGNGNASNNSLTGNSAANTLDGRGGVDVLKGGAGNDIYVVDNGSDQAIELSAADGHDSVYSSASFTIGANIEFLALTGSAAINGTGNAEDNGINGNSGVNILDGRGGSDLLKGGGGADQFQFSTALGAGNVDHVFDFAGGVDGIRLDNAVFSALGLGALSAGALQNGTAAIEADDRILYDAATGRLFYDFDGTGAGAAVLFAVLDTRPATLSASDFTVI